MFICRYVYLLIYVKIAFLINPCKQSVLECYLHLQKKINYEKKTPVLDLKCGVPRKINAMEPQTANVIR